MGRDIYGYPWGHEDSAHSAAVQYISECLTPANERDIYWTVSFARNDKVYGLRQLSLPTLHKLIGIIHHLSFNKSKGRHGRERFIPEICSGKYRTKPQRKAAIDSVYHFLYLIQGNERFDVGTLHDMLRGLPCNKKIFVNCSLPIRRKQVEALLKFLIRSIDNPYRDEFRHHPRGVSVSYDGTILINSEELVELLWRRHEDADRIITMFIEDETPVGLLEDRLETHAGLDAGVL